MFVSLGRSATPLRTGGNPADIPFSPLDLSPALWLDASDASTITATSGAVSQWDDKSGNNNHATQTTGSYQPTTGVKYQNGLNVLTFDGIDDYFTLPSSLHGLSSGDYTMFFVGIPDTTTGIRTYIYGPLSMSFQLRDTDTVRILSGASNYIGSYPRDLDPTQYCLKREGTALNLYEQGSSIASTTAGDATISALYLGATPGWSEYFSGGIAEVIIFDRALTPAEQAQVELYLAMRWGLGLSSFAALDLSAMADTPVAYYGTSRLSTYSGPCCRVVRDSDSAEMDVQFVNNKIDIASAEAFKGEGNVFVNTIYDQSGNGEDLTQSTQANMPVLDAASIGIKGGLQPISFDSYLGAADYTTYKRMANTTGPTVDEASFEIMAGVATQSAIGTNMFYCMPYNANDINLISSTNVGGLTMNGTLVNSTTPKNSPPIQPSVIGTSGNATTKTMRRDEIEESFSNADSGSISGIALGSNGYVDEAFFAGKFHLYGLAVMDSELSTSDRATLKGALDRACGKDDYTTYDNRIIFAGDSRTYGSGATYLRTTPRRVLDLLDKEAFIINNGKGGETLSGELSNIADRVTGMYVSGKNNILIQNGFGFNDFNTGRTSAQIQADFISWATSAAATGYKIIAVPCAPGQYLGGAAETYRQEWNTWLEANWATYCDAFVDINDDARIGTWSSAYYADYAHLNDAGYQIWADLLAPEINALLV